MKFKIIQTCENGNVSKSEIGRHYNMDGSDKVKPFVIGKFASPRAFQGVCSIPAMYKAWFYIVSTVIRTTLVGLLISY
jgi:hypothetical protein